MEISVTEVMSAKDKVEELGGTYRYSGGAIRVGIFGDDQESAEKLRVWLGNNGYNPGRVVEDPDAGFLLYLR